MTQSPRTTQRGRCDACGKRRQVAYRGWHDEGSAMLTCAGCGAPEDAIRPPRTTPLKRVWQHVCPAHDWTTVWSQNSPKCSFCGKEQPE